MAVKDKLVTLEDLKTAYDKLKEMMDMYEDITSSLTWSDATWVCSNASSKINVSGTGIKVTKITVTKGESYKVNGWVRPNFMLTNTDTSATFSYQPRTFVLTDASDNIISALGFQETNTNPPFYCDLKAFIPAAAKYLYIFDHAGNSNIGKTAGDIIVKKGI